MRPEARRAALHGLALAVAYAAIAWASLRLFATVNASASPVWPPTGLAIAALLLLGTRAWPGVFLGALAANALTAGNAATSLAIATGNTLEAVLAAAALRRWAGGPRALESTTGVLRFAAVSLLAPLVSASIGTASLLAAGFLEPGALRVVWMTWWLGDVGGAILVVPLLLRLRDPAPERLAETVAFFVLLSGITLAILAGSFPDGLLAFLALPLLVWPATRLAPRAAALAVVTVAAVAIVAAQRGGGLFGGLPPDASVLVLQGFLVEFGAMSLVIVAAVRERSRAQSSLVAVSESEARFRTLLEIAPDAILLVDGDGRIQLANGTAERMFGYAKGQLVGRPVEDLVPRDLVDRHVAHRQRYNANPTTRPMGVGLDLQARRQDGRLLPVEISLAPLATGQGPMVVTVVRDVTQRKQAEQERLEATRKEAELRQLRHVDQMKTDLLNLASHELNTPLTPVQLELRLLSQAALGAAERRSVDVIARNVSRLASLVKDILEATRLQGTVQLPMQRLDLGQELQALRGRATLDVDLPPATTVLADPRQLKQVLDHLLSNARKFSPPGSPVVVRARIQEADVLVEVVDQGRGLAPEAIPRLFQPFTQVHEPNAVTEAGTGLGLFIAKRIVTLHGGTMGASSAGPGTGSTFWFRLPRAT